jgi:fructokinase
LLAIIGEALMDVVDQGGHDSFLAHVGGSPLNVAGGLARLGQPTALMARFSTDAFGRILRAYAARVGVDLTLVVDTPAPSTMAVVELDEDGVPAYEFHTEGTADWGWTDAELDYLPPSVRIVHFGSLTSWMAPGASVVNRRVAALRADGDVLVSYDPNVRPGLLGDRHRAVAAIEASVANAHLVKASIEDLEWLYPGVDPGVVAHEWLQLGPELVVVTRGADGTSAFTGGDPVHRPVFPVPVVDTVGAGDAFMTGLLDGLVRAGAQSPAELGRFCVSAENVGHLLEDASVVAGLVCARAGASSPTRAEVDAARASV